MPNADYHSPYGWAWVALCLALAIHVIDEALTDFLSVYNPMIKALRQRWRFLPLPTFSFGVWLSGLILAVILLFAGFGAYPICPARAAPHARSGAR